MSLTRKALIGAAIAIIAAGAVWAQDISAGDTPPDAPVSSGADCMSIDRLGQILHALDPQAVRQGHGWRLRIGAQVVLVVADTDAGRLRAMVPVRITAGLDADDLARMLQANFDSALDGRYAIAQGLVWSVFVHPLEGLDKAHLISGLAQVVTLARSYGTDYSSGELRFGGGDGPASGGALIEELLRRGEDT
ncbi:hypothetical protein [Roseovarius sp. Pro17]|uniref:hypothetical protein n=1 Tax=Roseovarius sp. Pro17 TaxID=3108175 RepID=UPI002D78FFDF|nr:hypothetical protein [Roseovarius sp. Pro17]